MPYSVVLTLRDGSRVTADFRIYHGPTPSIGQEIDMTYEERAVKARVTGVTKYPSHSSGTAVEVVDHVTAREL